MTTPIENLKAVLEYFGISQQELAQALDVNASQVSRWLSGQRSLRASSPHMASLVEFILSKSRCVADIEWLKAQFEAAGLPAELSTVYRTKQNLTIWLAADGEMLHRNLANIPPASPAVAAKKPRPNCTHPSGDGAVKLGYLEIALGLTPILSELPQESSIDIFLSNDKIATIVHEDVSRLIIRMIEKNSLKIRLVVCISGNTQSMSRLIDTYMQPLVSGHIRLSVVHGLTQTVTNQMHLLVPGSTAMLVTETPGVAAPPVATIVIDRDFVVETQKSFEQTARYAQPVLNIYGDDFPRNILEIIYRALDVVKDNINPLYMTVDAYNRFLHTHGYSETEYAWRSAEFARFKSGMDETLKGGTVFREILSLTRLNRIAQEGFCRMPGLYFMKKGFVHLDAEGCAAILSGYLRYLETIPNFHVLILDGITMLHSDNCWQLKQNHHLAINHWHGTEPMMIHSDQLLLLREFQAHFDNLWAQAQDHWETETTSSPSCGMC